jgi:two-component system, cell cycle sensor histidine kinase and response regulator CckA
MDESIYGDEVILIVEDADLVRELVADTLESYGYRVLSASRGDEALALVESHDGDIDLLLTDVVMPGMNGGQLAERLVALQPSIKVLFTSGYPDDVVRRHGGAVAHDFLAKPYLPEDLARMIRRLLTT